MSAIAIEVLRVNGDREFLSVPKRDPFYRIQQLISCAICDCVNLKDGRVMIVDDTGMLDDKPVNPKATEMYRKICRPGTVHAIHGDVVIATDADFE